jgi:transcription initiation factor TFIIIB Brf1 subunit/transcription initiation factor TFIIB
MNEVVCNDPEYMSKTLHRRTAVNKIPGIKIHFINGKCIIELEDGMRQTILDRYDELRATRERMLTETRDRQKARLPKYSQKSRERKRIRHVTDNISNVVDIICYDFSESDKMFLKHEIGEKIGLANFRGRAYHVTIAALIYLLSKCPANSETPLQFKDVYTRYSKVDGHDQIRCLYDAVKDAKEAGVQSCKITCEMVITSKKDALLKYAEEKKIPQDEIRDIMSKSIDFTKLEAVKREMIGKNPFVVSAASFYLHRNQNTNITQDDVGYIFNVTPVSIRNTMRRFETIIPLQQQ